jgi:hypothetical protein
MSVNVREADLEDILPCASIALLGKRRSGKTTWAKRILESLNKQMDRFVVLCGNKDNISEWTRVIHPLYVVQKNLLYLKNLKDYQEDKVAKYSDNKLEIPKKYRITVILDDCGSDRTFMHSAIMKDLLSNGRHYGITLLILCQYLNQMHAENRDQLDYLGMLHTSNRKNIKKVHDEYVNMCEYRTFQFVLNACTLKRGLCWINNVGNQSNIENTVFFKKLPWPYDFEKVGSHHIRAYGTKHHAEQKKNPKPSFRYKIENTNTQGYDRNSSDSEDTNTFVDKKGSFIVKKISSTKPKME